MAVDTLSCGRRSAQKRLVRNKRNSKRIYGGSREVSNNIQGHPTFQINQKISSCHIWIGEIKRKGNESMWLCADFLQTK